MGFEVCFALQEDLYDVYEHADYCERVEYVVNHCQLRRGVYPYDVLDIISEEGEQGYYRYEKQELLRLEKLPDFVFADELIAQYGILLRPSHLQVEGHDSLLG
jgi:hypothetical protein